MRETLSATFQLAESSLEEGSFRGFASVFNTPVDAVVPTMIHPGAFTKTLQEHARRVRILWQHDDMEPIGLPVSMTETPTGLEVVGRISSTTRGRDTLTLMRDGVVTDLSIGFDPIRWDFEEREGQQPLRHVREVRLWEFSPVTWGANEPAKIAEVNSRARTATVSDADFIQLFLDRVRDTADPEQAMRLLFGPVMLFRRQRDAHADVGQRYLREATEAWTAAEDAPPAGEPEPESDAPTDAPEGEAPTDTEPETPPVEAPPADEARARAARAAFALAKLERARGQFAAWR